MLRIKSPIPFTVKLYQLQKQFKKLPIFLSFIDIQMTFVDILTEINVLFVQNISIFVFEIEKDLHVFHYFAKSLLDKFTKRLFIFIKKMFDISTVSWKGNKSSDMNTISGISRDITIYLLLYNLQYHT